MKNIRISLLAALLTFAAGVPAATFNLFQPAAGILKGNPSTYITTAAVSSDILATFSGTCNSSTVLKGDGSCAAVAAGTVTSVGLSMPSGFSVAGSPVTSTGTLAVTTTLNGVIHGNGSAFSASNVALASEVSGTLPVANGGTGATTLSGVLKGNTTSPIGSAASADVSALWSGTCNASSFLRGDGACAVPAGTGSAANPSGLIGMNAVNGVAATFGRSDSTHAIDPAIDPVWTGTHLFQHTATGSFTTSFFNPSSSTTALARISLGITAATTPASSGLIIGTSGVNYTGSPFADSGVSGNTAFVYTTTTGVPGFTAQPIIFAVGDLTRMVIGPSTYPTYSDIFFRNKPEAFKLLATAEPGNTWQGWYRSDGTTRKGFFGYDSVGVNNTLRLVNEETAGIQFKTTSGTVDLTTGGNVNIAAPASGVGTTINGISGSDALQVINASGTSRMQITSAADHTALYMSPASGKIGFMGTLTNTPLNFLANAATELSLLGGVQVGSPTGGYKGVGTLNATGLYVNGVSVGGGNPGFGVLSTTVSTCTVSSAYDHGNLSSCARNSIGSYTVTLSAASAVIPACVATMFAGSGPGFITVGGGSSTTILVTTYDSAGALADRSFVLNCMRQ